PQFARDHDPADRGGNDGCAAQGGAGPVPAARRVAVPHLGRTDIGSGLREVEPAAKGPSAGSRAEGPSSHQLSCSPVSQAARTSGVGGGPTSGTACTRDPPIFDPTRLALRHSASSGVLPLSARRSAASITITALRPR